MSFTLKRMTLRDQAYEVLREMIASHRFSSGKWINIEQLAKELGVSRTPVWQALKDLESEGLVKHVPNRGIQMAEMTLQMALELYAVRELLEGMAGRLAAQNISEESLSRLDVMLAEQLPIVRNLDQLAYSKADFQFHGLIYSSCGNWLLSELLENIKSRSRPFLCPLDSILPQLYQDHKNLVNALKKRDSDQAEKCMTEHNRRIRHHIEKYIQSNK